MDFAALSRNVRVFMSLPSDNPELLKAQYKAFSKQIPLMYFILLASMWALSATHFSSSPRWLVLHAPGLLTVLCAARILLWWKWRTDDPTYGQARKALAQTNYLSSLIAVLFSAWSIALFPYGDAYAQSHVAFFMAITVIGCIFCLMHLRPAAFTVAIIVNAVFITYFLSTGNPVFRALSLNVLLVTVAMLFILLGHYRDFTTLVESRMETEALGRENFRIANLDSLTDLPNRRSFLARLAEELEAAQRCGGKLTVGMIDLDGFKPVNDVYGHALGDRLLVEVGGRLKRIGCETSFVARLGGDEFALLVPHDGDDAGLAALGERLAAALAAPFRLNDVTISISGSVGFATYPDHGTDADRIFDHADYALYQAKRNKPGRAVFFSDEHCLAIKRDAEIERALRNADLEGEIDVAYQPIIDIGIGRTVGFEALARWTSPVLGAVSPGIFIPIAERSVLIGELTRVVLEKALAAARDWAPDLRLSVNLSAKDVGSPEGVLRVMSIVSKSGIDPHRIDFEITETAMMHDFQQAARAVEALRNFGCGVSLDDFGTGFSSLTHLHALPLTRIKVDRSFVTGLHERASGYKIVKSLLTLSRDMGLDCVMEGVETERELKELRELDCRHVQGYLLSRPMGRHDIAAFLRNGELTTAASA
ncbi:EAL domain-containing protein [Rhizobium sp. TRM95111]|uniref:putative bifunctional diguanylate cyclase/phosphodiesterase n=1 Tax=Rhizobium alarense TaxID=2846851 RepID=UPI001F479605|nr:EAL domain-containing protein [Rhizobium alarense]MCF3642893.1 EAL domain-containing protein [Rhizobium alarense]